mgnify:CR=1 FL=1
MMNAKSDNTTLFAETRNYMLKKIAELLAAGEKKLPTERELAEEVVASYATVRLVMKQLETEGFIRRIRGSGTYLEPEAEALLRQSSMRRLWYFRSGITAAGCGVKSAGVPPNETGISWRRWCSPTMNS